MMSKKRRLGKSVMHLDDSVWRACRENGITDFEVKRMQQELSSVGMTATATIAAAIVIRELKKSKGLKY